MCAEDTKLSANAFKGWWAERTSESQKGVLGPCEHKHSEQMHGALHPEQNHNTYDTCAGQRAFEMCCSKPEQHSLWPHMFAKDLHFFCKLASISYTWYWFGRCLLCCWNHIFDDESNVPQVNCLSTCCTSVQREIA